MVKTNSLPAIASIAFLALSTSAPTQAQQSSMSFFVTSVGPGKGGDLGGLEGADRHCQSLAQAVGAGGKTWRAYLSTQGTGAVNARDRIGKGPWQNAKGIVIANNVAELHGANNLNKQTALTERQRLDRADRDGRASQRLGCCLSSSCKCDRRRQGTQYRPPANR